MTRLAILAAAALIAGCTALHEPLEEAKPTESIRLSGKMEAVGHCLEKVLHERDTAGHYEFHAEEVEGTLDGNGEWEVILRQETPTSIRASIKTELTGMGAAKRPAGITLLIARCAGDA